MPRAEPSAAKRREDVSDVRDPDAPVSNPPPARAASPQKLVTPPKARALLTWFGVDVTSEALPLDVARTCLTPGCRRHVLLGELMCPVHLDLATPEELPDLVTQAQTRWTRGLRSIAVAAVLSVLGVVVGGVVQETRFGWLGAIASGGVVAAFVAREAGLPRFASLLGTLGFFAAVVLVFAGLIVGGIGALPLLLP